jgi:2-polyprenyl-3-methyl-5-hydroxy-6-metoxy-1,4-benzoquinol methylase
MGDIPRFHRKQWEIIYIAQALHMHGKLGPGKRGLGFGVGTEPLAAMFAAEGCTVTATDLPYDAAQSTIWPKIGQHSQSLEQMAFDGICPREEFLARVQFRPVDMNAVPADLRRGEFDFTWSSCSLEHLGSLEKSIEFIRASLECVGPGGVAVHTTEYNLTSNIWTVTEGDTIFFRKRDIERLVKQVRRAGCQIEVNLCRGHGPLDLAPDHPPYTQDRHIKLQIGPLSLTSIGLIIQNPL